MFPQWWFINGIWIQFAWQLLHIAFLIRFACQKSGRAVLFYTVFMPSLTPELIASFPLSRCADPGSIQRGRAWNVRLVNARKSVILVGSDSGEYTVEIEGSKKTGELLFECDCPCADEGHFCRHMVAAVLELKDFLEDERGFKYVYLDGQTPNRQSRVDRFQNDPTYPFFLISIKTGGVGIILTAADYVIHLNPWWNPAVEMQASDHVHRIGQEKPVFVYQISACDTVEEKILQLQEKKRACQKSHHDRGGLRQVVDAG
jgi:hypothetical protein